MIATDIFLFGTLLDEDVREIVFTGAPRLVAAQLDDYRRCRLPDESYPVLVPRADASIEGLVAFDLDEYNHARLEFFESDEYSLQPCRVRLADERIVDAHFYAEASTAPGASEPWKLAPWQSRHKARYLEMVRAYMALYGAASRDQAEALWEELSDRAGAS